MPGILVLLTLLVVLPSALVSAQTTGGVEGCITDSIGRPQSGATITATTQGNRLTVIADRGGCYEFRALPPNLYRVTARLAGFDNATRDKIKVAPGQMLQLDLIMGTSPICDCESPGTSLQQLTERASAVVYLSITDHDGELQAPRGYFTQTAHVIEILKDPPIDGPPFDPATKALHDLLKRDPSAGSIRTAITFLQDQSSGAPDPYAPSEEFVLFLHWWPAERTFIARTMHTSDRSDRDAVFVIQNGRVTRTPASLTRYVGAPVETLLVDLRKVLNKK